MNKNKGKNNIKKNKKVVINNHIKIINILIIDIVIVVDVVDRIHKAGLNYN